MNVVYLNNVRSPFYKRSISKYCALARFMNVVNLNIVRSPFYERSISKYCALAVL